MKYFSYYDYTGWEKHRGVILDYIKKYNLENKDFHLITLSDLKKDIPNFIEEMEYNGLYIIKIHIISFQPTDLSIKDISNPLSIFIHTDILDTDTSNIDYAFNIPLINCDSSTTFHYKLINADEKEEYHACGEPAFNFNNVEEVSSFQLYKPALCRISVPHGVHNPTNQLRVVASIRIDNNSPVLLNIK